MMRNDLLLGSIVIMVLYGGMAHSQTTTKVEVVLYTSPTCDPEKVWIVLGGNDLTPIKLQQDKTHWIGSTSPDKFVIQHTLASLRLDGARTGCRKALPLQSDTPGQYESIAIFKFKCSEQPAWKLKAHFTPARPYGYGYVRTVADGKVFNDGNDSPCVEAATISNDVPIHDVNFEQEKLRLQLDGADPKDTGLNIKELFKGAKKDKDRLTLNRNGIEYALVVQRAKGDASAPDLSSASIDMLERKYAGVTKLELTVEK